MSSPETRSRSNSRKEQIDRLTTKVTSGEGGRVSQRQRRIELTRLQFRQELEDRKQRRLKSNFLND